jgi:beta-phosphoglucomutase-like phosphatase (HAD superfamily)
MLTHLLFHREKLDSVEMPYAIMSHLGSSQLEAVLDVTGLAAYFPPEMRVSLCEHYSDEPSELLGGALRVEKHPEKCVVFDNTPSAAGTAHEVLMKCVSFVDPYPKYELSAADWTIGQLVDMELNQIRNLFSERDDNIPLAVAEAQGILKRRPAITRTS